MYNKKHYHIRMFFLNRQMFILSTLSVLRHFWLQPEPEVGANENEEKTHTGGSLINKEGWNCSVTGLQNLLLCWQSSSAVQC